MSAVERNPPLVLIPGHAATALSWRYQVESLGKDREIIIPDQHYLLSSIQDMARDIAARLPLQFDLAGWSMGGYIVFELHPLVRQRVRKLVFVSTMAGPETTEAGMRRADLLRSVETEGMSTVLLRHFDDNLAHPSRVDRAFKEAIVAESVRLGDTMLRNQIKAIGARRDSRPSLKDITCEVLIIAGREDAITPPECSEEMAALLPQSRLHILDEVGHCSPWEKPQDVNRLMREFLG